MRLGALVFLLACRGTSVAPAVDAKVRASAIRAAHDATAAALAPRDDRKHELRALEADEEAAAQLVEQLGPLLPRSKADAVELATRRAAAKAAFVAANQREHDFVAETAARAAERATAIAAQQAAELELLER